MKRADTGGDGVDGGRAGRPAKGAKAARPPKLTAPSAKATLAAGKRAKAKLKVSSDATVEAVSATGPDESRLESEAGVAAAADGAENASEINPVTFRRRLMAWYRTQARALPWRGSTDPYQIWVSEIMLQQTRVAAVIEHYNEFLHRFPTLVSLALAAEPDVLAAWSGLGYYRRARMLHKAAQFIMLEREGRLPASSLELRTLPGIGEYTAAAIASIAFGEAVAVVDGNVERVILRLTGRPSEATAATRAFIRAQAHALVPHAALLSSQLDSPDGPRGRRRLASAPRQQCRRRPQPGDDGTGSDCLPPTRSPVPAMPGLCVMPHARRTPEARARSTAKLAGRVPARSAQAWNDHRGLA